MRLKLILAFTFFCTCSAFADDFPISIVNDLQQCREISPILERLSCYDEIKINHDSKMLEQPLSQNMKGIVWQRANDQEKNRDEHNLQFIRIETEKPKPAVILTTPALGYSSQRPILMLSCIDNITRLQIALPQSLGKKASLNVVLSTERTQQQSQWFLRENGFVLEASRGLDGIKEIQHLFNASQLKVHIENDMINDLVFNIEQLDEVIKPLRAMCHW